MNLCATCGEDFGSVSAFDAHRVGKYTQAGPAEYTERLEQGLIRADEDWRSEPAFGRRCLSLDEMQERGMKKDKRGRWRLSVRGKPPWTSDVVPRKPGAPPSRPTSRPALNRARRRDTSPRSKA